ncbi:hypothetical protein JOE59_001302 [Agromyces cerinus]|uniref:DUF4328 domain-containing protein n=1 Tax=Agromyces cerinus TaxID=33878 RepID=UPI0019580C57|nr:DUF4328 domain-containing protein [Agromyces cerinus]MBM7830597.1 hypothetical protein [Agromyces cerinus]
MTIAPTPPPAGWYPAPDGSSATWWWDGARWTQQQQQQQHHQSNQPLATTNALARLAMATQVLLIVCGVMSVATIGIETFGISAVTNYLNGLNSAIGVFDMYDQSTFVVSIMSSVSILATGALWAIWQYRAVKQVTGRMRRSAGWHAGSWFVPIISFWFPYQNISDLWRAIGRTRPSWQIMWWLLWVLGNVVIQQSNRIYIAADDLDQLRVAMWLIIVGETLRLAAAPLAWLVVRGITGGILRSTVPAHSLAG